MQQGNEARQEEIEAGGVCVFIYLSYARVKRQQNKQHATASSAQVNAVFYILE